MFDSLHSPRVTYYEKSETMTCVYVEMERQIAKLSLLVYETQISDWSLLCQQVVRIFCNNDAFTVRIFTMINFSAPNQPSFLNSARSHS